MKTLLMGVGLLSLAFLLGLEQGYSRAAHQQSQAQLNALHVNELERVKLAKALKAANERAVQNIIEVQTQFVEIEKEVIRYVQTPKPAVNCQPNYGQWMQLHNRAAGASAD
ncbi:MAG: hypothetical protein ACRCWP_00850 [Shewanella sp.]